MARMREATIDKRIQIPEGIYESFKQLQQKKKLWKNIQDFLIDAAREKLLELEYLEYKKQEE